MKLEEFIDAKSEQIAPLEMKMNLSYWNQAVTGEERFEQELQKYQIELKELFRSEKDYQYLKAQKKPADVRVARQYELLWASYQENHISKELINKMVALGVEVEATYTKFRPVVRGKTVTDNEIKNILKTSENYQERKAAWEASKLIGEQVEGAVLELIVLRNKAAKEAGFSDYYSMSLELQEIDQDRLFGLLDQLKTLTDPIWQSYKGALDGRLVKRYGIKKEDLRPWHYEDPFFQEAPQADLKLDAFYAGKDLVEISKSFYQSVGMPVEDILARSDLFDRTNKCQHAFCTNINRKEDIRILCNLHPTEYWMGTQLHELGHAVYEKYVDQSLPFLLRTPAHISSTEAVAMLFGRLSKNEDFLVSYCGVDPKEAHKVGDLCKKQTAAALLVFARWGLVMCHFERAMYQNPGIDLRSLWWDMVEKYQGITRPEGRHSPDWAAKIHLATAPVYYQNYILGEMTASQLLHKLKLILAEKNQQFVKSPLVGSFLKEHLFKFGACRSWEATLQVATGELLNPSYFAGDIAILKG